MGSIRRALRVGRPLPEVEAEIAAMGEELPLTVAFASIMTREGNGRAAAIAIDEQRTRLAGAQRRMLHSFASRRRRRVHAAFAGLAAVLVLASGSFAAMRVIKPDAPGKSELIRQAAVKLDQASLANDAKTFAALVGEVHESILALPKDAFSDPTIRLQVQSIFGKEQSLLAKAPNATALLDQLQRLSKQVQVPAPEPETAPKPEPEPATPEAPPAPAEP
jgi:hypothetical protein